MGVQLRRLNNRKMRAIRKDIVYEGVMIDLCLLGIVDQKDVEALIGRSLEQTLVSPAVLANDEDQTQEPEVHDPGLGLGLSERQEEPKEEEEPFNPNKEEEGEADPDPKPELTENQENQPNTENTEHQPNTENQENQPNTENTEATPRRSFLGLGRRE